MTLDQANLFHQGIVVDDLEASIETVGRELGLTFSTPWPATQRVRGPRGEQDVPFVMAYSGEGPVHIELVQAVPDTLWAAQGAGILHHLGYWTDDLTADGELLKNAGLEFMFENVPEDGQDPTYAYYRSGLGYYIELVHSSFKPMLEGLWATTLAGKQ